MNARRQWAGWIVLLLWTVPTGAAPRQSDIDWEAERPHEFVTRLKLSVRDKRDIVRLAARMGLTSPVHVVVDHHVPGFCEFVRVDSLVQPEGNHHAWLELQIRPTAWRACHALEPDATVKRVGRWVAASSDLTKRALWRLQDGDSWFVDVELDDDGMYADARVIASAIRSRCAGSSNCENPDENDGRLTFVFGSRGNSTSPGGAVSIRLAYQ